MKRADRQDRVFFFRNPGRHYHARASIPFEVDGWGPNDHLTRPVMVVGDRINGGPFHRCAIAGDLRSVPDDEKFLALLWRHISTAPSGGGITISAETHLALLRMAGVAEGIPS